MRKTRSHVPTCNAVKFHTNSTRTNSLSLSLSVSTALNSRLTALHKPVALIWNPRTQATCQTVPIPCSFSDSHGMPEPRPHARQSLSHAYPCFYGMLEPRPHARQSLFHVSQKSNQLHTSSPTWTVCRATN